jgi:hypothetical protein
MKCFEDLSYSNYNAIQYFLPTSQQSSNMKFQVASFIKGDSVVYGPACKQVPFGHIRILWAIDSLGNGHFKPATGAASPPRSGSRPMVREKRKEVIVNKAIHGNESQERNSGYSANGRLLKTNNLQVLPCGVLVKKRDLPR